MRIKTKVFIIILVFISFFPTQVFAGPIIPPIIRHGDDNVDETVLINIKYLLENVPCSSLDTDYSSFVKCYSPGLKVESTASIPDIRVYDPWPINGIIRVPTMVAFDYQIETGYSGANSQKSNAGSDPSAKDAVELSWIRLDGYSSSPGVDNYYVNDKIRLLDYHADIILSSVPLRINTDGSLMVDDAFEIACNSDSVTVVTYDGTSGDFGGANASSYDDVLKIINAANTGETDVIEAYSNKNIIMMPEIADWYVFGEGNAYEIDFVGFDDSVGVNSKGGLWKGSSARTPLKLWDYVNGQLDLPYGPKQLLPYGTEAQNFEALPGEIQESGNTSPVNDTPSREENSTDTSTTTGGGLWPYVEYSQGILEKDGWDQELTNLKTDSTKNATDMVLTQGACPSFFSFIPVVTSAHNSQNKQYNGQYGFEFAFQTTWYVYMRAEWSDVLYYNENYKRCQDFESLRYTRDYNNYLEEYANYLIKNTRYKYDLLPAYEEAFADYENGIGSEPIEPIKPNEPYFTKTENDYLAACGVQWENKSTSLSQPTSGEWYVVELKNPAAQLYDMRDDVTGSLTSTSWVYPVFQGQLELINP